MTRGTTSDTGIRRSRRYGIVPPYLLARIADSQGERFRYAADAARQSLLRDDPFRSVRTGEPLGSLRPPGVLAEREGAASGRPDRTVSDAQNREDLPGVVVRSEGDPEVADVAVNEAYDALGATYDLYEEVYGRDSIDGRGMPLHATVHYGDRYDNAFWDGERMVFGDGDGEVFRRFTLAVDVVGHELTHGVIDATAKLVYQGQSGALNESVADVFGALVAQYAKRQTAEQASWLIGEGLFTDEVQGVALRSMRSPGTAYDDDVLGKDPQPDHWSGFVETVDDNGGVHVNSGIPNRAFAEAAIALGGFAWDRMGQVWYDTITGSIPPNATFAQFAARTIAAAVARYGDGSSEADAVRGGWTTVGVDPADG